MMRVGFCCLFLSLPTGLFVPRHLQFLWNWLLICFKCWGFRPVFGVLEACFCCFIPRFCLITLYDSVEIRFISIQKRCVSFDMPKSLKMHNPKELRLDT